MESLHDHSEKKKGGLFKTSFPSPEALVKQRMFSGRQAVSASVLPGSGGTYPGPDYLKRQPTPTASHGQAMSTVQVGNNYEMIFDSEGQDGDAEGMAVHEDLLEKLRKEVGPASPAASIVISDVLPLDEATPYRGDARRSSQVHVSSSAASYTSPQVLAPSIQLPLAAPRASAASSMDLKRLRTRKEPKPISVEVAEAIAVMDQEITEEGRPKKRGRGRPKGSVKGASCEIAALPTASAHTWHDSQQTCRISRDFGECHSSASPVAWCRSKETWPTQQGTRDNNEGNVSQK